MISASNSTHPDTYALIQWKNASIFCRETTQFDWTMETLKKVLILLSSLGFLSASNSTHPGVIKPITTRRKPKDESSINTFFRVSIVQSNCVVSLQKILAFSMPAPGLPMPHVVVFCIFNKLRLEKLVHLVWNC
jgi:hypothetical protein